MNDLSDFLDLHIYNLLLHAVIENLFTISLLIWATYADNMQGYAYARVLDHS